jgi:hypothetical protein
MIFTGVPHHFNAIFTLFNAIFTPLTPFQRRFNAVLTPF